MDAVKSKVIEFKMTHVQTERGGTEKERKRKLKRKGRQRETGRGRERRAGAVETLEMTACKYTNGGPPKWRWRGGRIKSSEHCVIMDQFGAIKPPYGWSPWNGEISAPQGQPWWQWRSQTMGVTEGDTPMEGKEHQRDRKKLRWSVLNISIQAWAEGLSNYANSRRWWWRPLAISEQRADCCHCELWSC